MSDKRNIFEDDKKLMHLCEDFLHQLITLKKLAEKDPEQYPTATKLISILRYEGDPEPLTMEEYLQLQDFIGDPESGRSDYAEWKLALIKDSAESFIDEHGMPKNILFDSGMEN